MNFAHGYKLYYWTIIFKDYFKKQDYQRCLYAGILLLLILEFITYRIGINLFSRFNISYI